MERLRGKSLKARFRDILPVPRHDVPLSDILEFKRHRRDQLLAFRQQISAIELALSHCDHEAFESFLAELEKYLAADPEALPGRWFVVFLHDDIERHGELSAGLTPGADGFQAQDGCPPSRAGSKS